MAGTAAVLAISMVAGAVASKAMAPKIQAPGSPGAVPGLDPMDALTKATGAGDQQKKRAAGAMGRSDTILTGPRGLGEIGAANTQTKSLLGY